MFWSVLAYSLAAFFVIVVLLQIFGELTAPYKRSGLMDPVFVRVAAGPHAGRSGNVVGFPYFGNLWHRRLTINVPATEAEIREKYEAGYGDRIGELFDEMEQGRGPRHWVRVWYWQVEPVAESAPPGQ